MTQPEMRPERDAAIRAMLMEHARTEPVAQAKRRRRRVLGWSGIGVLAIGVAATAGAVLLQPTEVSNTELVLCMTQDERGADGGYPGSSATIASPSGAGRVADAVGLCRLMWEQGVFDDTFDPTAASNPPGRVPDELQACVLADGTAAVVPSSNASICAALGLAPLDD
ncbi:hypothetical protein [Agromyces cerinus]|uniref:Uncharacterized protein n=1 Tax=Agromyces cerinus subsp. cerinus TaxID=232089 RepID=A0A1N6FB95_9MICO|nr:hypothetical protein [Agromyces cerinus]SIN92494.1 hypothetical protein SAMN05443544_1899 [Agromyces cerinus subsp. cerinus]